MGGLDHDPEPIAAIDPEAAQEFQDALNEAPERPEDPMGIPEPGEPVDVYRAPVTSRQTGYQDPYMYTITDTQFGEFKVLSTSSGWWKDKNKLTRLIDAYKLGCPDEEARAYAGVRKGGLEYFVGLHPEFEDIKAICQQVPYLAARKTIVGAIAKDANHAFRYMTTKKRAEFGTRVDITTGDQPLQASPETAKAVETAMAAFFDGKGEDMNTSKDNGPEQGQPEAAAAPEDGAGHTA